MRILVDRMRLYNYILGNLDHQSDLTPQLPHEHLFALPFSKFGKYLLIRAFRDNGLPESWDHLVNISF